MANPNDPNYYYGQQSASYGWSDASQQGDGLSFDMDSNFGQDQYEMLNNTLDTLHRNHFIFISGTFNPLTTLEMPCRTQEHSLGSIHQPKAMTLLTLDQLLRRTAASSTSPQILHPIHQQLEALLILMMSHLSLKVTTILPTYCPLSQTFYLIWFPVVYRAGNQSWSHPSKGKSTLKQMLRLKRRIVSADTPFVVCAEVRNMPSHWFILCPDFSAEMIGVTQLSDVTRSELFFFLPSHLRHSKATLWCHL